MIDLSQAVITTAERKPPRIVLYGQAGIGKTTFAASCPKPVIVCVEDGAGNIAVPKLYVSDWQSTMAVLTALATQEHDYKTVVIDTIDRLEAHIHAEVVSSHKSKISSIEEIGYGKGYVLALQYWEKLLKVLDVLHSKGIMTLLLAHSIVKAHNPPDGEPFDRYRLSLHDKAALRICEWADTVIFAKYDITTTKDGQKSKGIAGERMLYTEERPAHWGKNRCGLPYELDFTKDVSKTLIKQICGINGKKAQEVATDASN